MSGKRRRISPCDKRSLLLIVGFTGSGKTSLVRRLIHERGTAERRFAKHGCIPTYPQLCQLRRLRHLPSELTMFTSDLSIDTKPLSLSRSPAGWA